MNASARLRVGVSACLLGDKVRWNGAHKLAVDLVEAFGDDVEWVRFCPEVEIGLGVPREPIELIADRGLTLLVTVKSRRDLTEKMTSYARRRTAELLTENLDGAILKSESPSCGLFTSVRPADAPEAILPGRGLFASHFAPALFDVPVIEESRVTHPEEVLHFVERMLAGRRIRRTLEGECGPGALAKFVEQHELQLSCHSANARPALETLVAGMERPSKVDARRLRHAFARALLIRPTRERRAGALRRARNRVVPGVEPTRRTAIEDAILDFERGRAPFAVPRILLREAAATLDDALLLAQTLLNPEPLERRLHEST